MEKEPSSARLFGALDLPEDARAELVRWREPALGDQEALRLLRPEALHVTLVFLGHLPHSEIPRIGGIVERALVPGPPPCLRALGVKAVPPRRPRLLALDLDDDGGRAGTIQRALAEALARAGLHEPEARPFWPHITLARVRKGGRVKPGPPGAPPASQWPAAAVTLYRSRLSPHGARYEPVARVPLAGGHS